MAIKSNFDIEFLGTDGNNYWIGRDGQIPVAIVNHIMSRGADGTLATVDSVHNYFSSKASEVSAHFGVARSGRIVQYVDLINTAWGNGILEIPDLTIPWLAECVKYKINPNKRTISIEHEGDSNIPLTDVQYEATLWLHKKLIREWSIIPDDKHIIGHYRITGKQRANCPGAAFPWKKLFEGLTMSKSIINGFELSDPFLTYYNNNGGLPVFGFPISALIKNADFGPSVLSFQWFERARLEYHSDGNIYRGLVGNEAFVAWFHYKNPSTT